LRLRRVDQRCGRLNPCSRACRFRGRHARVLRYSRGDRKQRQRKPSYNAPLRPLGWLVMRSRSFCLHRRVQRSYTQVLAVVSALEGSAP
jgi:hypothetical protein